MSEVTKLVERWKNLAATLDHGVRKRTLSDCAEELSERLETQFVDVAPAAGNEALTTSMRNLVNELIPHGGSLRDEFMRRLATAPPEQAKCPHGHPEKGLTCGPECQPQDSLARKGPSPELGNADEQGHPSPARPGERSTGQSPDRSSPESLPQPEAASAGALSAERIVRTCLHCKEAPVQLGRAYCDECFHELLNGDCAAPGCKHERAHG